MKTASLALPCLLLSALVSSAAPAQTQASPDTADASLGRLFHTSQQRSILDELRRRNAPINAAQQADQISLQGIVRRSTGHNTVWINGKPHHDSAPVAAIGKQSVRVFVGEGKTLELKVGERIELAPPATKP